MEHAMRSVLLLCIVASCVAFSAPNLPLISRSALPLHSASHYKPINLPMRSKSARLSVLGLAASDTPDPSSITSALVAFGHYGSFLGGFGLLTAERLLLKEDLTAEEATKLSFIDAAYGIVGLVILGTGYLRATHYAKGWDFYAHSPFFYGKMLALGVLAGLSLYPTITFIKWAITAAKLEDKSVPLPALEERVIKRLRFFTQHEIYVFFAIPFCAAMMARGIGYTESVPMWAMALGAILPTAGACAYSVKAALADTAAWDEAVAKQLGQTEAGP